MKKIIKIILLLVLPFSVSTVEIFANEKIKIGLLVPITGKNSEIGLSIIKSTRLAINKINSSSVEIIPGDTESSPEGALKAAKEMANLGIKIVIGPVFNKNLVYLDELTEITFLSLTNKNNNTSRNIINAGINATSQINAIKKFIESNEIKKTIFLTPDVAYKKEIIKAISNSKIKIIKNYIYNTDPTKLTKQIEKITRYKIRKQNLEDEIVRLEKLNENSNDRLIEKLKKKDTLGNVNFDSIIIADFDESLKSVTTSLLYTDISPKKKYFIHLINGLMSHYLKKPALNQFIFHQSIKKIMMNFLKNIFKSLINIQISYLF